MERIVQVAEEEGEQIIELPVEESDGSLLYSTLVKYFPKARGLRYYTEIDTIRGVKLANGKFYPPHINWGSTVYYCVFLEEFENETAASAKKEATAEVEFDNESHFSIRNVETSNTSEGREDEASKSNLLAQNFQEIKHEPGPQMKEVVTSESSKKLIKYRTISNRRPHRCDICGNCFTQQSHMQRHRRIHTGEKPFSCEACGEKFSRSDKLKLHTYKCHAIAQLVNATTGTTATSASEHSEVREKREKRPKILDDSYEWGTLPPVTKNKNLTVTFKKKHSADNENTNGDYYSVVSMAEVRMDDGGEPKYFDCPLCSKTFAKKNQLQRHARTHTGERPYPCNICDKSFTRVDALKRHRASVGHKKQKEQHPEMEETINIENLVDPLDVTNEMEYSNGDLMMAGDGEDIEDEGDDGEQMDLNDDTGMTGDYDDDDDETSCDVASFAQVTYANLETSRSEENLAVVELNQKSNEKYCSLCHHSFTNTFNYNRHMNSHDKASKSYQCTYCHYLFRRQSHLTRHMLIHTGEKPFHCSQCEEKFSRSDKLKLHISRVHSDPEIISEISAGIIKSNLASLGMANVDFTNSGIATADTVKSEITNTEDGNSEIFNPGSIKSEITDRGIPDLDMSNPDIARMDIADPNVVKAN